MHTVFTELFLWAVVTGLLWIVFWTIRRQYAAHKELMDRFMAVSETLGSYRARQEQKALEDGEYFFLDKEQDEVTKRVTVRGGHSTVEEFEGTMGTVTPESPA